MNFYELGTDGPLWILIAGTFVGAMLAVLGIGALVLAGLGRPIKPRGPVLMIIGGIIIAILGCIIYVAVGGILELGPVTFGGE